jgi:hypothetical protein
MITHVVIRIRHIALLIAICLLATGTMVAQRSKRANTADIGGLRIIVLEGKDAVNNGLETVTLVVEIRDRNDRTVEGATVDFQLPLMGPSGSFEGGVRNKQVISNSEGQASAPFTPNAERGRLTIEVKATSGALTGMATIMQRNSAESVPGIGNWFGRHKKLVIIGAVVIAGTTIGVILATRGGSSTAGSSSNPTLTISPGIPTVGGPQ